MAVDALEPAGARGGKADVFGHPRGLVTLASTELWDRISFHGMQALLVLYMVGQLLLPGHVEHIAGFRGFRAAIEFFTGPLSTQALSSMIFGLYVGAVAFTPVFGGLLGDQLLGRRRTVALGAVLMTAGHFCMAFDRSFLLALLLLILGAGCLRGNLAPQVGELYAKDDRRRDVAFQIYGSAVNLGAFIAPIVTGILGQAYGWSFAFGFAGVGMLVGLVIYLVGARDLPAEAPRGPKAVKRKLRPDEWKVVGLLVCLVPLASTFWVAQSQVWNTYNLWVRDHIDLKLGSWTMPVPWLQSLDGLAPFVMLPPMLLMWRWQAARGKEPDEFGKIAIGCFIFAAGTLWLAGAQWVVGADGRTPLIWAVVFHMVSNLGWLYFAPTAIALFSRAGPAPVNATLVGLYYLSVTLGSVVSGRLGGLYEHMSAAWFWTLHAAICAGGGVVFLVVGATFRTALATGARAEAAAA